MPTHHPLKNIQLWLQTVIRHPDGISAGIASSEASGILDVSCEEIQQVILPSKMMTSDERLEIYSKAYFGRLIDCLRSQFPAVRHATGDDAFDGFAFGYLVQYPSTTYTLGALGDHFDQYLEATRPVAPNASGSHEPDFADFLIDLARLERVYSEVFDGPGPEGTRSLEAGDLVELSPEEFAECRLILHGCVRLLELRFPVHEYASGVRRRIEPLPPVPGSVYLVITRRDYIVRRYEITRQQYELLNAINEKMTISDAIQKVLEGSEIDTKVMGANLRTWFKEWTAAPLFASMIRSCDRS